MPTMTAVRQNGEDVTERISVNLDNATIGDLVLFEEWGSGQMNARAMIQFLDRVVISETQVADMPLTRLNVIMRAITEDLSGGGMDPKD